MDLLYVGIAILLIAINAFFAMAEYSLVRIRESRLEELARKGKRLAPLIRFALDHLDGYMSTVQLGITMTSLGLGWVGEPAVARLIHRLFPLLDRSSTTGIATSLSFLAAFLLITGLHILFGELVPKLMAVRNPERYAGFTILPMTGFYYLAFVPMQALRRAANGVLKLFGIKGSASEEVHSEDEIKILLEAREEEGGLSLQRLLMFENLFDFGHTVVREVMTPRGSIAYLSCARSWEENLTVMMQYKRSRYPVCEDEIDSVRGYVHIKDLAFEYMTGEKEPDLLELARPILSLQGGTTLEECLRRFQAKRVSLAVVLDKRKKVTGLISMEDVVEEIVGEIRDEFERPPRASLAPAFVAEACDLERRGPGPLRAAARGRSAPARRPPGVQAGGRPGAGLPAGEGPELRPGLRDRLPPRPHPEPDRPPVHLPALPGRGGLPRAGRPAGAHGLPDPHSLLRAAGPAGPAVQAGQAGGEHPAAGAPPGGGERRGGAGGDHGLRGDHTPLNRTCRYS